MSLYNFSRRQFLTSTGTAAAAIGTSSVFGSHLFSASGFRREDDDKFKISLAEWSLHRTLRKGEMSNLDFPVAAKEKYGITGVEYVNRFFSDKAKDEKYLAELKKRCDDNGVESVLIMVDGEGQLGAPQDDARKMSVENHHRWVEAAKFLGCHSIRVNAGSAGSYDEQSKLAADGLRQLCEFAQPLEINVIVENHGGLSSNGQWLARVIRNVNMDNCGTLPDFGNFNLGGGKVYDRYIGVSALMPFAKAVSAKSTEFDENGEETKTDFMRMMQIVMDAGYHGFVGIEYEGGKLSEHDGILATKKLLEQCREKLVLPA